MLATCWAAGAEVLARAVVAEPWAYWPFPAGRNFPFLAYHLLGLGGGGRWDVVCIGGFGCAESCANVPGRRAFRSVICSALAVVEAALALAVGPLAALQGREFGRCCRST